MYNVSFFRFLLHGMVCRGLGYIGLSECALSPSLTVTPIVWFEFAMSQATKPKTNPSLSSVYVLLDVPTFMYQMYVIVHPGENSFAQHFCLKIHIPVGLGL